MLFFSFMLVVPLLPIYLAETYGASKEMTGIALAGYTVVAMLTRAGSGFLVDRYPRRVMLLLGFVLLTFFFAGYVWAGSLMLFAVVRTLHGFPFGLSTVANSTVAVDVLPLSRRAEGIGYYGLSNNVATAISPTVGLWMYEQWHDFDLLFWCSMGIAALGVVLVAGIHPQPRVAAVPVAAPHGIGRFYLLVGWPEGLTIACYSLAYGVVSTYVAIYGREALGITSGSGFFFSLLAMSLIVSRLWGSRTLRKGRVVYNAAFGSCISAVGYLLFATLPNAFGYYGCALLVGLGNGHLWPAFQTMFISLGSDRQRGVANASLLTSWDLGVGLGVLFGGFLIEHFGYTAAFFGGWVVEMLGVVFFFGYARASYVRRFTALSQSRLSNK